MSGAARGAVLALLVLATSGARFSTNRATTPPEMAPPIAPAIVLNQYGAALERVGRPPNLAFEVSIEQVGPRNLEQAHRIYRSGNNERDEIVAVDGQTLTSPAIRIIRDRTYRYDVHALAPRLADYVFTYIGVEQVGNRYRYRFKAEPHAPAPFSVTEVVIDAGSFLPATIRFDATGAGTRGRGELVFARVERYWLIREASVIVHLANGGLARERITWSKYRFPSALPPSTFEGPRPLSLQTPAIAP